jgi:hypothetical protein
LCTIESVGYVECWRLISPLSGYAAAVDHCNDSVSYRRGELQI